MSAAHDLFARMAGRLPTPVQELDGSRLRERAVRLLLKRDDLIDPAIPGNKWRKLVHNLLAAEEQGCMTLLTFGGAYSNHIRAVAAAGRACGFRTIGVIRGDGLGERIRERCTCYRTESTVRAAQGCGGGAEVAARRPKADSFTS